MKKKALLRALIVFLLAWGVHASAWARGASPYLPLNLSPEIERQIERVLVLAGKPVMSRPIAAAVVLDALPRACERDRPLCERVRTYLQTYMGRYSVTSLKPEIAFVDGDSDAVIPNRHGQPVDSSWQVSASGYWQPSDYIVVNAGVIAYDGSTTATGSFVSLGWDFAQLDIGFRDHWLSPARDSTSLIGTEASTMPSITLSNYKPLTPLGLSYQVFAAEMSHQDGIQYLDTTTSGNPRLAGLQLAIEPVTGYGLAVNRVVQYGGGARNEDNELSQFFDVLFGTSNNPDVSGTSLEEGNKVASLTSSIAFPGKVPFAVRVEYAGEDNAFKGSTRLGATNLTLGLDFPILWSSYDLTYEISEWQNSWYVHHIYPEGLTNDGRVIGHWSGDNRIFGDAIGGLSQSLAVGWQMPSGDYLRATYRYLSYDTDWAGPDAVRPYDTLQTLEISYSTSLFGHGLEAQVFAGQDIFGESFARIGAAFDLAQKRPRASRTIDDYSEQTSMTEVFLDVGMQTSEVREILLDLGPNISTDDTSYHLGFGARRPVSRRNDLGVRMDIDSVDGNSLVSIRAIDYRFRFNRKLAAGAFFGAGRYDIDLPAYGYYWGAGLQYMDVIPGWDIGLDYRHHEKLTRDKVLPNDPPYTVQMPRRAIDINGVNLYVSWRW